MLRVSQALVASEVGDGRSAWATQSLPLKSLPLRASWHFRPLFLLNGQTRGGSRIEGVEADGSPKPGPRTGLCTGPRRASWGQSCGPPVYLAAGGRWPGAGKAVADPCRKTGCGICGEWRAERFARGSPACMATSEKGPPSRPCKSTGSRSLPLSLAECVHLSDIVSANGSPSKASLCHHALGRVLRKQVNSVQPCPWGS